MDCSLLTLFQLQGCLDSVLPYVPQGPLQANGKYEVIKRVYTKKGRQTSFINNLAGSYQLLRDDADGTLI